MTDLVALSATVNRITQNYCEEDSLQCRWGMGFSLSSAILVGVHIMEKLWFWPRQTGISHASGLRQNFCLLEAVKPRGLLEF